jgi:hypothetical protein
MEISRPRCKFKRRFREITQEKKKGRRHRETSLVDVRQCTEVDKGGKERKKRSNPLPSHPLKNTIDQRPILSHHHKKGEKKIIQRRTYLITVIANRLGFNHDELIAY